MAFVALQAAGCETNKQADWLNKALDSLDDAGKSPMVQLMVGLIHYKLKSYK